MGLFSDIKQAFGGNCNNIDGRYHPDKNNPNSNPELVDYTKPCSAYIIGEDGNPTGVLVPDVDDTDPQYGNKFSAPDVCMPNVGGLIGEYTKSDTINGYIDSYCSNITPDGPATVPPQDFLEQSYLGNTEPEWLSINQYNIQVSKTQTQTTKQQIQNESDFKKIKDFTENDCYYNDLHPPTKVGGFGCCRGTCAIRGKSGSCVRNPLGYKASPFRCCLQDYNCAVDANLNLRPTDDSLLPLCYQNSSIPKNKYACNPMFRGMTQPACKTTMFAFCTGQLPFVDNQSSLLQAWSLDSDPLIIGDDPDNRYNLTIQAPCLNFLARLLTTGAGVCNWDQFLKATSVAGILKTTINSSDLLLAQQMMSKLLDSFIATNGSPIGAVNKDAYIQSSSFVNWYFDFCKQYPLLCQDSLKNNLCIDYSLDDVANNPDIAKWCGCYLKNSEYTQYSQYNVGIECTPTCNQSGVIPIINSETGIPQVCTQNICIMDDIAIKLINSQSGDISFTQACHSCGQNTVDRIVDASSSTQTFNTASSNFTGYHILPITSLQKENLLSEGHNIHPDQGGLVGYLEVAVYPLNGNITIQNISNPNVGGGTAVFTTRSDTIPGGNTGIDASYITGFTTLPGGFKGNVNTNDVFKINLMVDNQYFFFRIIGFSGSGNNNTSSTSSQSIGNYVSQFNLGKNVNTCNCIFHNTTVSLVDSSIKGANFNENCGSSNTTAGGNTVPNSVSLDNNLTEVNTIKSSIDSTQSFIQDIELDKSKFIITTMSSSMFILAVMQYFLSKKPMEYGRIIILACVAIVIAIGLIYLYYSFTVDWGAAENLISSLGV
jgi:hypothetical protein